ncbi:hypothetical protein N7475_003894 [Penicillium sp. IBT 31633x]|nr:hypothetical protein N7475_003894 [Penicillium sp. IBT 31633x]
MSTELSRRGIKSVCDLCHSRKVRCDRRDPCGNCQDAGIPCDRRRAVKRRCLSTRPKRATSRSSTRSLQLGTTPGSDFNEVDNLLDVELSVPRSMPPHVLNDMRQPRVGIVYDPVYDAQLTIQHQLSHLRGLTLDRRNVLETALCVIKVVSDNSKALAQGNHNDGLAEFDSATPSAELLTWMLKDIQTDRFGSFVADYYRHISFPTLKEMGLSLVRNKSSNHDHIIHTVCFNSVAYKFLTTVINLEEDTDIATELRRRAIGYRSAAQAALKQIPLLIPSSVSLLQAFLCGIFLHQGSGDVGLSGDLTKAACNTCIDLDLQTKVLCGSATEEELFCFIWCYILDRNHAFKSRTSRCLLDVQLPYTFNDLYQTYPPMSELFLIYLDLARVQDAVVSYSHDTSLQYGAGEYMLQQMQYINQRMHQLASLSLEWKGLDSQTEMSALKFAYQSVMTGILYLLQSDPNQSTSTDGYLQSARQELLALVSMCHSAEKQTAVNFLNWTILLYPTTAYLVLFCNVVATSDIGDFNLMKAIADCLAQTGISYPLVQLRTLFQKFLGLSRGFFNDERNAIQMIHTSGMESSLSYPVGNPNPFMLSWDRDPLVFNQLDSLIYIFRTVIRLSQ